MSFAELMREVERLTPEEKEQLRRHLALQKIARDPEWAAEMDRRIANVRAGKFATQDDLERIHAERLTQGR